MTTNITRHTVVKSITPHSGQGSVTRRYPHKTLEDKLPEKSVEYLGQQIERFSALRYVGE
jgi:hypothetical protein